LEIYDDDKSASTTDSDRLEFLKLIKKRKMEKQKKMAWNDNVSNKKMKSHCINVVFSVDGTILEASQVSTTVTRTG
jgi:hypothetical protein